MKIGTTELVVGGILLLLLWPKKPQSGNGVKPSTPRTAPQLPTTSADKAPVTDPQVGCPYHAVI